MNCLILAINLWSIIANFYTIVEVASPKYVIDRGTVIPHCHKAMHGTWCEEAIQMLLYVQIDVVNGLSSCTCVSCDKQPYYSRYIYYRV